MWELLWKINFLNLVADGHNGAMLFHATKRKINQSNLNFFVLFKFRRPLYLRALKQIVSIAYGTEILLQ